MPVGNDSNRIPPELVLGTRMKDRVPAADQARQRREVKAILARLRQQPGVILADEVGMGKTFVALAIAYSVAIRSPRGPVIVMVPANLIDKWEQDLATFCELYLDNRRPVCCHGARRKDLIAPEAVRYGTARHSVELMRLLDDPRRRRCHLILLAQGAMSRSQTDKWVRLALISEALRRHGRDDGERLIKVKRQIHRFLAELLWAIGEERAHNWGDELWKNLLKTESSAWKRIYNGAVNDERKRLDDDPVPKSVDRALRRIDLSPLAKALEQMPLLARGGQERVSERINIARRALRAVEEQLWKDLLSQARWRSPLLIMDEAHHLKNPGTSLARQLQSADSDSDLRTGDGAMAKRFDRMLFLTATPFQLGHHELVRVLQRFGDVRWDTTQLGERGRFLDRLRRLEKRLDGSQRAAVALQRRWSRLRPEDCENDVETWWTRLRSSPRDELTSHQRAVVEGFDETRRCRELAEESLRRWIVRHNKGTHWVGTEIERRRRIDGAAVMDAVGATGLPVPAAQLLPFFLAARSAVNPGKDLLGDALCSSYEAFRNTREQRTPDRDERDDESDDVDLTHSGWYLQEFDAALTRCTGKVHPKIAATVRRVVGLWEKGEKVLVFAFYRQTCAALRIHISEEIRRRTAELARQRLTPAGKSIEGVAVDQVLARIQDRYFDAPDVPGRRALDRALRSIVNRRRSDLIAKGVQKQDLAQVVDVMRRFLRVPTTLVRCFPLGEHDDLEPAIAVERMLGNQDDTKVTWRGKFEAFVDFLTDHCSTTERVDYLEAASGTRTGGIRVDADLMAVDDEDGKESIVTVANVQVATGRTRRDTRLRLMRAFNTPFFPDIFVCSQVMGEGVDLQRYCRHVIHHDLAWNPSTIEQRTGRIDRLGCKAQGRDPIRVYLPYLAGAADERQYRVMTEREQWFRVVMGQDEVARLITPDSNGAAPLPRSVADELSFNLELEASR